MERSRRAQRLQLFSGAEEGMRSHPQPSRSRSRTISFDLSSSFQCLPTAVVSSVGQCCRGLFGAQVSSVKRSSEAKDLRLTSNRMQSQACVVTTLSPDYHSFPVVAFDLLVTSRRAISVEDITDIGSRDDAGDLPLWTGQERMHGRDAQRGLPIACVLLLRSQGSDGEARNHAGRRLNAAERREVGVGVRGLTILAPS